MEYPRPHSSTVRDGIAILLIVPYGVVMAVEMRVSGGKSEGKKESRRHGDNTRVNTDDRFVELDAGVQMTVLLREDNSAREWRRKEVQRMPSNGLAVSQTRMKNVAEGEEHDKKVGLERMTRLPMHRDSAIPKGVT
jgi:hypothetical protein